jgi:hypothetical protein
MKRISELSQLAIKRQISVIQYPTGKFGFVGSGIPSNLAHDENGHTRVFNTREDAELAGKQAGIL